MVVASDATTRRGMKKKQSTSLSNKPTNCEAELRSIYLKLINGLITPEQAQQATIIIGIIREIQANGY